MAEEQNSNGGTHPQQDPTIAKIDELMLRLSRYRELLLEIGDPREAVAVAMNRVRELLGVIASATAPPDAVSLAVAAMPEAKARNELLVPRALWRNEAESVVDRLHDALAEPEPPDEEIRDRVAKYLGTLIAQLRTDYVGWMNGDPGRVNERRSEGSAAEHLRALVTPEGMADQMIGALRRQFPAYGMRLERHRVDLGDRMAKLKDAPGRGRPKGDGPSHAALSAEALREEILGWLFQNATAGAIKERQRRQRKK